MPPIPPLDLAALFVSYGMWQAFGYLVDHPHLSRQSLTAAVNAARLQWMVRIVDRDNRIVDGSLLANLMRSVSFFASATVLILGGVAAMAGGSERTYGTLQAIPFVAPVTKEVFEGKLLMLGLIFIYSFLKFTWSLRQFNYCCILVGSAPDRSDPEEEKRGFVVQAARVNELGARSFNQGLRGYYFALAILAWFLHPLAFIAATLAVVAILWRREFHSRTRRAMRGTP